MLADLRPPTPCCASWRCRSRPCVHAAAQANGFVALNLAPALARARLAARARRPAGRQRHRGGCTTASRCIAARRLVAVTHGARGRDPAAPRARGRVGRAAAHRAGRHHRRRRHLRRRADGGTAGAGPPAAALAFACAAGAASDDAGGRAAVAADARRGGGAGGAGLRHDDRARARSSSLAAWTAGTPASRAALLRRTCCAACSATASSILKDHDVPTALLDRRVLDGGAPVRAAGRGEAPLRGGPARLHPVRHRACQGQPLPRPEGVLAASGASRLGAGRGARARPAPTRTTFAAQSSGPTPGRSSATPSARCSPASTRRAARCSRRWRRGSACRRDYFDPLVRHRHLGAARHPLSAGAARRRTRTACARPRTRTSTS